jgi:hypothetical protein
VLKRKFNVCIVEPIAAAGYLAKRFNEENIGSIVIKLVDSKQLRITKSYVEAKKADINYQAFDHVFNFDVQNDALETLITKLIQLKVIMVLSGSEYGVELTDKLASKVSPFCANNPVTAKYRFDKYWMQEAIAMAEYKSRYLYN